MQHILILGAGRSASDYIQYFIDRSESHDYRITVADAAPEQVRKRVAETERVRIVHLDVHNEEALSGYISEADLAASFLPYSLHALVGRVCLKHDTHLVTASYITEEMAELDAAVRERDLVFLNEIGMDPGIDHLITMRHIERIRNEGGRIHAVRSFGGALVTPDSAKGNPWGYKFTWAPMNVITAGQSGAARYLESGEVRYRPYQRLFRDSEQLPAPGGFGILEYYPNRNAFPYREHYGLDELDTFVRGTLRVPGFCAGWHALVQLGLTDNTYRIERAEGSTYADWVRAYLPEKYQEVARKDLPSAVAAFLDLDPQDKVMDKLRWLEIFDDLPLKRTEGTPADFLLDLLLEKWSFDSEDRDLIVMVHEFVFEKEGEWRKLRASLSVAGQSATRTAIAQTVGLPSAIASKLILQAKVEGRGVFRPLKKELYDPILDELAELGIKFSEEETPYGGEVSKNKVESA